MAQAIEGVIKFKNPPKYNQQSGKTSESIAIVPQTGGDMIYVSGKQGWFANLSVGDTVFVEHDGRFWKLVKNPNAEQRPNGSHNGAAQRSSSSQPAQQQPAQPYDAQKAQELSVQLLSLYDGIMAAVQMDAAFSALAPNIQASIANNIFQETLRRV